MRPLALALVAVVLLAGCASVAGDPWAATDTTTPETVTAVPVPEPPDEPSPEVITEYAGDRERAVTVNARTGPTTVEVATDCAASFDRWVDGDYYAIADCDGSVTSVHDGSRSVNGFTGPPAVYRVDREAAQRVPLDDDRTLAEPYRGDDTDTVSRARGLTLVNFDDRSTSVTVRIVHEESGETALNGTYRIGAVDDRSVRDVLLREGRYRVEVTADDGTTSRSTWEVRPEDAPGDYGFAVYVTPGSGVTLGSFE
jgi:hypothetical protein